LVPPAKIDKSVGLFIDAYVRGMDDIATHLEHIKEKIVACNKQFIESARRREQTALDKENSNQAEGASPQGKLDAIVAGLKFGA
jgi:hypothetical protein